MRNPLSKKPKTPSQTSQKKRGTPKWTGSVVEGRDVRIRVDWELCMGAASCVALAPKVFKLDWAKKKSVADPAPLEVLDEKGTAPETIFLAAQSCPYRAIKLEDSATKEQLYP